MTARREMTLTAELVARIHRSVADPGPAEGFVPLVDEDFDAIAAELLASPHAGGDLWLFAYGSLLWKPACEVDGQEPALLRGWHRAFCLRLRRYRGTPDCPGLMMALDRGGACRGVAQRLPAAQAHEPRGADLCRRAIDRGHRRGARQGLRALGHRRGIPAQHRAASRGAGHPRPLSVAAAAAGRREDPVGRNLIPLSAAPSARRRRPA